MIYNRLIVAAIGFIRLEPYDGKLSRTVLRGGKDSNALLLPDSAIIRMYSSCADIKEIIPYFLIPFQANTTGKCLRFNLLNIYKKSKFFRNNIPVNWKIYLKSLHPCIEIKTFIQYNQY